MGYIMGVTDHLKARESTKHKYGIFICVFRPFPSLLWLVYIVFFSSLNSFVGEMQLYSYFLILSLEMRHHRETPICTVPFFAFYFINQIKAEWSFIKQQLTRREEAVLSVQASSFVMCNTFCQKPWKCQPPSQCWESNSSGEQADSSG